MGRIEYVSKDIDKAGETQQLELYFAKGEDTDGSRISIYQTHKDLAQRRTDTSRVTGKVQS